MNAHVRTRNTVRDGILRCLASASTDSNWKRTVAPKQKQTKKKHDTRDITDAQHGRHRRIKTRFSAERRELHASEAPSRMLSRVADARSPWRRATGHGWRVTKPERIHGTVSRSVLSIVIYCLRGFGHSYLIYSAYLLSLRSDVRRS